MAGTVASPDSPRASIASFLPALGFGGDIQLEPVDLKGRSRMINCNLHPWERCLSCSVLWVGVQERGLVWPPHPADRGRNLGPGRRAWSGAFPSLRKFISIMSKLFRFHKPHQSSIP